MSDLELTRISEKKESKHPQNVLASHLQGGNGHLCILTLRNLGQCVGLMPVICWDASCLIAVIKWTDCVWTISAAADGLNLMGSVLLSTKVLVAWRLPWPELILMQDARKWVQACAANQCVLSQVCQTGLRTSGGLELDFRCILEPELVLQFSASLVLSGFGCCGGLRSGLGFVWICEFRRKD